MSNEIKAPVIDGFDECTIDEWNKPGDTTYVEFVIEGIDYCFYYKRIKPKEKSNQEIAKDMAVSIWGDDSANIDSIQKLVLRILDHVSENYVKKEG